MSWFEDPGADDFLGLKLTELKLDEAYVNISSSAANSTSVYRLLGECNKCPFSRVVSMASPLDNNGTEEYLGASKGVHYKVLAVDTADQLTWRVYFNQDNYTISQHNRTDLLCELQPSMGEFGVYRLDVNDTDCTFTTLKEPVDIYKPLWVFLGALGVIWLTSALRALTLGVSRRGRMDTIKPTTASRLRSLDIFRGISVIMMILGSYGMGGYRFGAHSAWDGLPLGDVVLPAFLWIMGVGIPLKTQSLLIKDATRISMLLNIFRRSCLLFMMGLALSNVSCSDLTDLRILGVLQRFAITYFVVATMFAVFTKKYRPHAKGKLSAFFWDVAGVGPQWIVTIMLLSLHTAVVYLLPVPGCPRGYAGPGGMHLDWAHVGCSGGITRALDALILGETHLYQKSEVMRVYSSSLNVEPEGLMSTIPSILTVMLGAQAGASVTMARGAQREASARLLLQAVVVGALGTVLCGGSFGDNGPIPLNKNIWSLSFVLVTAALSAAVLAIVSALSDEREGRPWERLAPRWSGAPFLAAGRNALLLYVGHQLLYSVFPFQWGLGAMSSHLHSLLECSMGATLWLIIAALFHRKRVYVTV